VSDGGVFVLGWVQGCTHPKTGRAIPGFYETMGKKGEPKKQFHSLFFLSVTLYGIKTYTCYTTVYKTIFFWRYCYPKLFYDNYRKLLSFEIFIIDAYIYCHNLIKRHSLLLLLIFFSAQGISCNYLFSNTFYSVGYCRG